MQWKPPLQLVCKGRATLQLQGEKTGIAILYHMAPLIFKAA